MEQEPRIGPIRAWISLILTASVLWALIVAGSGTASQNVASSDSAEATVPFKNALVYNLHVKTFQDSDGDGVGDFNGLTSRLDYLKEIGTDAIWLAPFYPSPGKDDGYDVADYYSIDKALGSLEDFRRFMSEAERRNIRVLTDLVVNHTSDQHPWFQQARRDPQSPYRSWYVWSKEKPQNQHTGMIFPGVQEEIWTYDAVAGEYYYHRFYGFQPDLNTQNPAVQTEIRKIIRHWVTLGVSGFRLDAVPFLVEVPQTKGDEFPRKLEDLTELRRYLETLRREAVLLGEANVKAEESKDYFGHSGERLNMMFNFFVNQQMFHTLASGDAQPLKNALEDTRDIPASS